MICVWFDPTCYEYRQFAQRSRVRKLQYIAELERNVKALQAEGSEVSAELEFLSQQNLILGMENKALKQRLETVSQEQLIKYCEHPYSQLEFWQSDLMVSFFLNVELVLDDSLFLAQFQLNFKKRNVIFITCFF